MSKKAGVIFDMDGTLWDSAQQVAESWTQVTLKTKGVERAVTAEDLQSVMGKTMDKIADALFPTLPIKERMDLLEECCRVENEYLRENGGTLYEGVEETFKALKAAGYHVYIVSNCQSGYIEAFLDYYGLWSHIEDIECFGNNNKPKGENIRLVVERNSLDKAVYVGDIQGDYEASKDAGVGFIHAAYGFGKIDTPVAAIKDIAQLPELIKTELPLE